MLAISRKFDLCTAMQHILFATALKIQVCQAALAFPASTAADRKIDTIESQAL
jgi:hypothetical protein